MTFIYVNGVEYCYESDFLLAWYTEKYQLEHHKPPVLAASRSVQYI